MSQDNSKTNKPRIGMTNHLSGGGVIPFNPPDKTVLYKSYMPFVKGGGLYIVTSKRYEIGTEVFLLVKMPESQERLPAVGKVVWINRSGSVSQPSGVGVQLMETPENEIVKDKIEILIAGFPEDTPTFTM